MSEWSPHLITEKTIPEHVQAATDLPEGARALTFVSTGEGADDVVPYSQLARDVRRFAARFSQYGVRPGDRIALVIPDSRAFVTAFLGALHTGAVPVPLYPPMRIASLGEYLVQARHIIESANPRLIVTDGQVRRVLGSLVGRDRGLVTTSDLWTGREEAPLAPRAMEDLAFLQYTSGSTAQPKGVQLTYANLATNMRCIATGLEIDPSVDVGISWLPLYHDMGLIGCVLTAVSTRFPLVVIPPLNFLKRPGSWLKRMSDHRGSLSFAPNFGYGLTTRRVRPSELEGLDLSAWRVAGCGAEPIHRATLRGFAERFAAAGFREEAFLPCYGLAESTLAVSFTRLGQGARSIHVSRRVLLEQGRAQTLPADDPEAVELVPCGTAFDEHQIDILSEDGPVDEGFVGEIAVRGASVTQGYFNAPEHNAALFEGEWLRTGDLGFVFEGQLVICGRKKDLIIVQGRNHYASDIEGVVTLLPGVRRGQVAAFGVQVGQSEAVVVCVEARPDAEPEALKAQIRSAIMERFGLKGTEVVILPRGTMPKTSSGKIRRHQARARYLAGQPEGTRDNRLTTAQHLVSSQIGLLRHQIAGFLGRLKPAPQPRQDT